MITKWCKIVEIASHESFALGMNVLVSTLNVGLPKLIACVKVKSLRFNIDLYSYIAHEGFSFVT